MKDGLADRSSIGMIERVRCSQEEGVMRRQITECPECHGTGEITHLRFGSAYKITCKSCSGSGKVTTPTKSGQENHDERKPRY